MIRVPPGRTGRLWLRQRLATAARAATLLEHKLRILREEQQRLRRQAALTAERWREAAATADTWLLRATLAGGQRSLRLATTSDRATVTITWSSLMGVRHPTGATCEAPRRPDGAAVYGNAALVRAEAAYRAALDAAVRHAVALAAVRVVDREVAATRRRIRALDRRWIPQLRRALATLESVLEEQERVEGLTRRLAVRNGPAAARGGAGLSEQG